MRGLGQTKDKTDDGLAASSARTPDCHAVWWMAIAVSLSLSFVFVVAGENLVLR